MKRADFIDKIKGRFFFLKDIDYPNNFWEDIVEDATRRLTSLCGKTYFRFIMKTDSPLVLTDPIYNEIKTPVKLYPLVSTQNDVFLFDDTLFISSFMTDSMRFESYIFAKAFLQQFKVFLGGEFSFKWDSITRKLYWSYKTGVIGFLVQYLMNFTIYKTSDYDDFDIKDEELCDWIFEYACALYRQRISLLLEMGKMYGVSEIPSSFSSYQEDIERLEQDVRDRYPFLMGIRG